MGGKSRKTGEVSSKLIQRLKRQWQQRPPQEQKKPGVTSTSGLIGGSDDETKSK